jgi:hypothetical protein
VAETAYLAMPRAAALLELKNQSTHLAGARTGFRKPLLLGKRRLARVYRIRSARRPREVACCVGRKRA